MSVDDYVNKRGMRYENEYEKGELRIGGGCLGGELMMKVEEGFVEGIGFELIYEDEGENIELEGECVDLR
uniref:hypothetical protein n=1 Tax=Bacillus sp. WP8 TaxID=756828 RepID=UPI0011A61727